MAKKVLAVVFGFALAPAFIAADFSNPFSLSGAFGNQLVGDPCAVRVYHPNFQFPPEGGKIVKVGEELFFIRTYKPGCALAGSFGEVVVSSPNGFNPLLNGGGTFVNPAFTTPTTQQVLGTQTPAQLVDPAAVRSTTCY